MTDICFTSVVCLFWRDLEDPVHSKDHTDPQEVKVPFLRLVLLLLHGHRGVVVCTHLSLAIAGTDKGDTKPSSVIALGSSGTLCCNCDPVGCGILHSPPHPPFRLSLRPVETGALRRKWQPIHHASFYSNQTVVVHNCS